MPIGTSFQNKNNGLYSFEVSFFVSEIFEILCYANKQIDDVISGSAGRWITKSRISLKV